MNGPLQPGSDYLPVHANNPHGDPGPANLYQCSVPCFFDAGGFVLLNFIIPAGMLAL
jgi:hypothetical protein